MPRLAPVIKAVRPLRRPGRVLVFMASYMDTSRVASEFLKF
jgi:hypothetical protein